MSRKLVNATTIADGECMSYVLTWSYGWTREVWRQFVVVEFNTILILAAVRKWGLLRILAWRKLTEKLQHRIQTKEVEALWIDIVRVSDMVHKAFDSIYIRIHDSGIYGVMDKAEAIWKARCAQCRCGWFTDFWLLI